jgi:hypothetical protein
MCNYNHTRFEKGKLICIECKEANTPDNVHDLLKQHEDATRKLAGLLLSHNRHSLSDKLMQDKV